jgi:rubredoxin
MAEGPVKCAACGRFIADERLAASHNGFEPLSEFGPERSEWTCPECVERERWEDELWAAQPSSGPGWFG